MKVFFQLLDCDRDGPHKWATLTIWSPENTDERLVKNFATLSDASDAAHEIATFLKAGTKLEIRHGEVMTYTIE